MLVVNDEEFAGSQSQGSSSSSEFPFFCAFCCKLDEEPSKEAKKIFMLGSMRDSSRKKKRRKFDANIEIISPPFNFKVDLVSSKYWFHSILNPSQFLSCSKTPSKARLISSCPSLLMMTFLPFLCDFLVIGVVQMRRILIMHRIS